jgi:hypothetical protein
MSVTLKENLAHLIAILYETFQIASFKRDYDTSFGRICNMLRKYGIDENPRNLRFRCESLTAPITRPDKVRARIDTLKVNRLLLISLFSLTIIVGLNYEDVLKSHVYST